MAAAVQGNWAVSLPQACLSGGSTASWHHPKRRHWAPPYLTMLGQNNGANIGNIPYSKPRCLCYPQIYTSSISPTSHTRHDDIFPLPLVPWLKTSNLQTTCSCSPSSS